MMTRPIGTKSLELGDKLEMANKKRFAEDRGYQVLCSLVSQYARDSGSNTQECKILTGALQLFHKTLVSGKQSSDPLTIEKVINLHQMN